jgi:subtilisin family serine protease
MKRAFLLLAIGSAAAWGCTDSPQPLEPPLDPSVQASALVAGADDTAPVPTGRYLILGARETLPRNLASSVAAAGGSLVRTYPEIGVAVAEGGGDRFVEDAAGIRGVESVIPDMVIQWVDPQVGRSAQMVSLGAGRATVEGAAAEGVIEDNAFFGSFQWAPQAIRAPEAWLAGYTGAGVRVAIVDGGMWDQHMDIAPNLDVGASASFVPGFAFNEDGGTFWHATHVGGIVAAAGQGTFGIAPEATLIGVKVLHNGSGAFEWVLNGVLYAATPVEEGGGGADIINLSLGATIPFGQEWDDKEFRDWFREARKIHDRVMRYAYQRGVTVIAAAGNNGADYDERKDLYQVPAESDLVVAVAATGPHGWAYSGATDFDRPAFYTNHGKSLLHVAAPGGTPGLYVIDEVDALCTVTGTYVTITNFCEVFDMVMSPIRGLGTTWYAWAYGTSMAAPAAAGVAALIIEANGGAMNPRAVAAALAASATDLGKPGKDGWYGHGWVDALSAIER